VRGQLTVNYQTNLLLPILTTIANQTISNGGECNSSLPISGQSNQPNGLRLQEKGGLNPLPSAQLWFLLWSEKQPNQTLGFMTAATQLNVFTDREI